MDKKVISDDIKEDSKPPLGLTPKKIHSSLRIKAIFEAMTRYIDNGKSIPQEWVDELEEILPEHVSND